MAGLWKLGEPDRLVMIQERTPGYSTMELSAPNYRDVAAGTRLTYKDSDKFSPSP